MTDSSISHTASAAGLWLPMVAATWLAACGGGGPVTTSDASQTDAGRNGRESDVGALPLFPDGQIEVDAAGLDATHVDATGSDASAPDSGTDGRLDSSADSGTDASPDSTVDSASDSSPDSTVDSASDSSPDSTVDSTPHPSPDSTVDSTPDPAADAGFDPTAETGVDVGSADGGPSPAPGACPTGYGLPEVTGLLADPEITEASGIVASTRSPGVLWLHNDSGDDARLFALSTQGAALGRLTLDGVDAVDFEDMATGPCPDGVDQCLWVGDTGNNDRNRHQVVIYAVTEPPVDVEVPLGDVPAAMIWRFPVTFPDDAPFDSEALLVEPDGSTFYMIEKIDGAFARVFAHPTPLEPDVAAELIEVATLESPGLPIPMGRMITAADLHPTQPRLLIRVYTGSFEYRLAADQGLEDLGDVPATVVAWGPLTEPQGEAITYDETGRGFWTVSEGGEAPLHHYPCTD